jgi:radical SAM-linked protein
MKLVVEFMKMGRACYISHLDLQRALLRGLRMSGLTPAYSAGFNPHPKLSLVLPLTLGFESLCELAEVETGETDIRDAAINTLNDNLPDGIIVTGVSVKEELGGDGREAVLSRKPLAARVSAAGYTIVAPPPASSDGRSVRELVDAYLGQEKIFVRKENRKKGRTDTVDIRPMIHEFVTERDVADRARYACVLSASAGAVLNPLTMIESFYGFCGAEYDGPSSYITRTRIIFDDYRNK